MDFDAKGCCGCGCGAVVLGLLVLLIGGYLWGSSVYGEGDSARDVAHDMASYEFPGSEVGVMSLDTFGFRLAATRSADDLLMLYLLRYPFTSEASSTVRRDVFTEMHQSEGISLESANQTTGTLCGRSTQVVETNGTVERNGEQQPARGLEACVKREDHIFCAFTLGDRSEWSTTRRLFETLECQ
jgi:hypothetical protein